jgi:hypothetical protein
MKRISVSLPEEAYEALRWRAFTEREPVAVIATQLLCGALDSEGRVADAPGPNAAQSPSAPATSATRQDGRAEREPVIPVKERSGAHSTTTAPDVTPDWRGKKL